MTSGVRRVGAGGPWPGQHAGHPGWPSSVPLSNAGVTNMLQALGLGRKVKVEAILINLEKKKSICSLLFVLGNQQTCLSWLLMVFFVGDLNGLMVS